MQWQPAPREKQGLELVQSELSEFQPSSVFNQLSTPGNGFPASPVFHLSLCK